MATEPRKAAEKTARTKTEPAPKAAPAAKAPPEEPRQEGYEGTFEETGDDGRKRWTDGAWREA